MEIQNFPGDDVGQPANKSAMNTIVRKKEKKEPITCFRLISCVIGFVVSGGNKATAEFERDAWNDSCIWYTPLWYHQQEGETRRQLFNFQIMCVQCEFLKSTVRDSQV